MIDVSPETAGWNQTVPESIPVKFLLSLYLLSASLRLLALSTLIDFVGTDSLTTLIIDITNYYESAAGILHDFDFTHHGVIVFGPGYPSILAFFGLFCNLNPAVLSLIQVLLVSASPPLLSMFAFQLTGDKPTAYVAGILAALSAVSIGLSSLLLSDSFFFLLLVAALTLLFKGLKEKTIWPHLLSAVLLSITALTRSVGIYFPVVIFLIALVQLWPLSLSSPYQLWKQIRAPLIPLLLPLIVSVSWATHNYYSHNFFDVAIAAPHGISRIVRQIRAEVAGVSYEEATAEFGKEMESKPEYIAMGYHPVLSDYTRSELLRLIKEHPKATFHVCSDNAFENITVDSGGRLLLMGGESSWKEFYFVLTQNEWWRYKILALTIIGLVVLLLRRQHKIWISLFLITLYFAALSSFAIWQGSRIFYPGQIGWAVVVATLLVYGGRRFSRLIQRLRQS